jgi:hypothetical protein
MRQQRIIWVLSELSSRVAECNTTMEMLQDDFNHSRRASMQIRKAAHKCIAMANVVMCRFIDIANSIGMDEDCAMMETFHRRRVVFNHYEQYFK